MTNKTKNRRLVPELSALIERFRKSHTWPVNSKDGTIKLYPCHNKDLDVMYGWFKDLQLVKYAFGLHDLPNSELLAIAERFRSQRSYLKIHGLSIWNDKGVLLGIIHFSEHNTNQGRFALAGIMIGEAQYRGKGNGTKAMEALLSHIFTATRAEAVEMETAVYNKQAQRSFEKAGFKPCDKLFTLEGLEMAENEKVDAPKIWLRCTKEDWEKSNLESSLSNKKNPDY